jgi:DNA polymerase-3 subunit delta
VKATKASVGRSVDQPDAKTRFYLFHGQDEGQSRALAARLMQALTATKVSIAAAQVKEEPGLLAVEAAAMSLFGERQLIWIEPAGEDIVAGVGQLLRAEASEIPVIAIAGALRKGSALLNLAEGSPLALAFAAYLPEGQDAARMVAEVGRTFGLKIAQPVAARVAEYCANDQAIVAQELRKLALYLDATPNTPKDLDHEAVDAVGTETGESDFLRLADLALNGDLEALGEELPRLSSTGKEAIPVLRSLQRRLLMLAPARARIERGEQLGAVMTSFGRSLFWKDKSAVERMLRHWNAVDLAKVAERAGALERDLIFTKVAERDALGEELVAIARKARARR